MRLHDALDYHARERGDADLAVQDGRRISYRQAQAATERIAAALIDAGLAPGDRMAVLSKNSIEYVLLYYAASRVGVVPVPLNYRSAPPEWAHIVDDAGAKLLIAGREYLDAVDAVSSEMGPVRCFIALGGAPGETTALAGWADFEAWIGEQAADPPSGPPRPIGPDDDLYQLYTSGTTGQPKGAVLGQRAVVANLRQIGQCAHRGEPGARSLVVGPMLHAGVVWSTLAPLSWGGSLYIVEDFDAAELVRILSEERIDYASLVPTVAHDPEHRPGRRRACVPFIAADQQRLGADLRADTARGSGGVPLRGGARVRPDGEHGSAHRDGPRRLRARPAGQAGAAALGGARPARDGAADRGRAG